MRLILASRNEHKLRELRQILPGIELEPLPEGVELPPETGSTFAENASIKARAAHEATGAAVLADDSGIEAAALDGDPGVRSARFAGENASDEENLVLLLERLEGVADRSVAYVCVLSLVGEDGEEVTFEGRCEGRFVAEPRGTGGFGYDPGFVPEATGSDDERTMAELPPAEKDAISHRGLAGRLVAEHLGAGAGERP